MLSTGPSLGLLAVKENTFIKLTPFSLLGRRPRWFYTAYSQTPLALDSCFSEWVQLLTTAVKMF